MAVAPNVEGRNDIPRIRARECQSFCFLFFVFSNRLQNTRHPLIKQAQEELNLTADPG